jgi:hypothetical protein
MDLAMTDISIKCSRFKAAIILFVGIPLLILFVLVLLAIMVTIPLMPKGIGGFGTQNAITTYLMFPLLIVGFCWVMWSVIRYREALFTTIRVSTGGVVVEYHRYGVLLLNWGDITHATYSSFGKMIILESPKLLKPLAIMNFGSRGLAPEFLAARTLIQGAISNRWSQKRL